MSEELVDRKQEILDAALEEFVRKGSERARMQSIADQVGVTKAMIHYYFDTKEKLFNRVYSEAGKMLLGGLMNILESEQDLFQKIDSFIRQALDRFHSRPELTAFVVNELNQNPEKLGKLMWKHLDFDRAIFDNQLKAAASNYEIAPVSSQEVLANIFSLCLFPCSGRAFMERLIQIDDPQQYNEFLRRRSGTVSDTIMNWLAS